MSLIEIWLYDANGVYLHQSTAQENPKDPGKYIMPTLSTDKKPEVVSGLWPVFKNNDWDYAEDNRGTVYIKATGAEVIYSDLGPLPDTLVKIKPVLPNVTGFLEGLASGLNDIVVANTLLTKYPLLQHVLAVGNYTDANILLQDALTTNTITQKQYEGIITIASNNNIPLSLS